MLPVLIPERIALKEIMLASLHLVLAKFEHLALALFFTLLVDCFTFIRWLKAEWHKHVRGTRHQEVLL
jgi:hypothetical protein